MTTLGLRTLLCLPLLASALGCADSGGESESSCIAGATQPCVCPGEEGAQTCSSEGTWGACRCSGSAETEGEAPTGSAEAGDSASETETSEEDSAFDDGSTGGGDTVEDCLPGVARLEPGSSAQLSSAGPGTTTGVFCIMVPDDAEAVVFALEGGTCDGDGVCGDADTVLLYFKSADLPDHTDPDGQTKTWQHSVGGSGQFGTVVTPGPAYLVTDDGAHTLGYQDVTLRVSLGEVGGGTPGDEDCTRIPEADDFACPPGLPPAAYECFGPPPAGCVPGLGFEFCCP